MGEAKVPQVCSRCSLYGHNYVGCDKKPLCYLCRLTHSVGDKYRCEVMKSVKKCFENALKLINLNVDPHLLSIFQILDYMDNDPVPVPHIPKNLKLNLPTMKNEITIKIKNKNKGKDKNKDQITMKNTQNPE